MPLHLALLPGDATHHSKLLSWDDHWHHESTTRDTLWGWNPDTSAATSDCSAYPGTQFTPLALDPPPYNFPTGFCSGHSALSSGGLLITGGVDEAPGVGSRQSVIFNQNAPAGAQWSAQGGLTAGRWYPTNTSLPDGNIMTFSGTMFWPTVVFGGTTAPQDPTSATDSTIYRLGLNFAGQWLTPVTKPPGAPWPPSREGHSAAWREDPADTAMIVFGGRTNGGPPLKLLQDTWELKVTEQSDRYEYTWAQIIPTEDPPSLRTQHSAVVLSDGRMIVYGGLDASSQPRSDVWELKLSGVPPAWHWTQLFPTVISSPGARYGHAAVYDTVNSKNRMLVFGGVTSGGGLANNEVYALSFDTNPPTWSLVTTGGTKPAARDGHSLLVDPVLRVRAPGDTARRVVLFGGRTSSSPQNDTWVLWIEPNGQMDWQSISTSGGPPAGRSRHAAMWDRTPGLDRMVIFGGDTGTSASAEVWALNPVFWAWRQLQTQPSSALAGQTAVYYPPLLRTPVFNVGRAMFALNPELFVPSSGLWTEKNAPQLVPVYPFMFVVPSGKVFFAGPGNTTSLFNWSAPTPVWQQYPATPSDSAGASAVMFRPGEIMKCGRDIFDCRVGGYTAKIKIDASEGTTSWMPSYNKMKGRIHHNLTVLPNGQVLVTGGLVGCLTDLGETLNPSVKQPELWDPDGGPLGQGAWSSVTLASDPARRGYHSTALLLPDGRVLSAGGESPDSNAAFWDRATIYCPPYLFNPDGSLATRPTITHSFNMDQRYVPLTILDRCSGQLIVSAPADSNLAPPGYYLLFILNSGVPSIAKWVRVLPRRGQPSLDTCDGIAPAAVTDLTLCMMYTSAQPSWSAPGDDGDCGTAEEYDLRYSLYPITAANFNGATRAGAPAPQPAGTPQSAVVTGLTPCTWYYFAIKTRDDKNQWSAISNLPSGQTRCSSTPPILCDEGGMMAQGWGDGGWAPENSLFWESPVIVASDSYRLRGTGAPVDGEYRTRLVQVGGGSAVLDQVSLGAVDHDPGLSAFAGQDSVFLGTTTAVTRATDDSGAEVTGLVNGSSVQPYLGAAGRGLVVELGSNASPSTGLVIESAGYTPGVPADSTGILVQKPGSDGSWTTIAHLHPRRTFDRHAVSAGGSATLRLVFLREHSIRSLERLAVTRTAIPSRLDPARAAHSRLGDVAGAVGSSGGTTAALLSGDNLELSFGATPVASGQVRDLFLFAHGTYTSLSALSALSASSEGGSLAPESAQTFEFSLGLARPNPAVGEIRIGYSLARDAAVTLRVYDIAGRLVRTLATRRQTAGLHEVTWDGRGENGTRIEPGAYFYRLASGVWQSQRRLVMLAR